MATRPAWAYHKGRVIKCDFNFEWNGGFAVSQKRKNIAALHEAILSKYGEKALEISTKSLDEMGCSLSAFNLKLDGVLLECVFQSSKVFENGGPYRDLLDVSPKEAKRDERLKTSGKLIAFEYNSERWELEPKTAFYDYIYIKSALGTFSSEQLKEAFNQYTWFTDIEFNPNRSINSQARSVAILKSIILNDCQYVLDERDSWIEYHKKVVGNS